MKFSRHLLIGVLALVLGGCGTTVQESLKVAPTVKSTVGADRTVVILPFADYSYADNLESAYRRNLFINENCAMTDSAILRTAIKSVFMGKHRIQGNAPQA